MPTRILGKTERQVSLLSFGGGSQFLKNKDGDWEVLLERAVELGINYFDTSADYRYGASMTGEERYGMILPKYRERILLSTKVNSRDPDEAAKEFEQSLKRLKTDHVDFLMIHGIKPSEDIAALEKGLYKKMLEFKAQGMARFIGFSCMDSAEKAKELIETLELDVAMLAMNPTKYGHFAEIALPAAREKNLGVIVMKVMRDIVGKDAEAKELLGYGLSLEGGATAMIGHYGMDILEENVRLVKEFTAKKVVVDCQGLEKRLAHLAGPHALCWARDDYYDGMMC